ncbi:MAG: YdeI/OmpD-associated family protein [Candidatus Saccharibacteria bacterium]
MSKTQEAARIITFKTRLFTIGATTIARLPESASSKLPSRGQAMVEGTLNGVALRTPLEPDGRFSHWLIVDADMQKAAHATAGSIVELVITPVRQWPEPEIPADLQRALTANPDVHALWQRITPMARWEWIRWARATGKSETRKRRVDVAISKLKAGERRPCCWNRNLCTVPEVSKNGVLLQPSTADQR